MTVLVGGKNSNCIFNFDRDNAGYVQVHLTGTDYIGEPTPWHTKPHTG